VLPGLWRLRLPLPWPGVPHCNAWAIASGSGIVLIDTGMHEPGSLPQLERALDQVNLRLEHVRLLACTHAHSDHWGQAAPILERAGCELWMHPNHAHGTQSVEDPGAALARRLEVGRQSGVPEEALARYAERAKEIPSGVARVTARCCRGSRSRPISAPGRSTRPRVTLPRTYACTRQSDDC
jgi:glyoxylase-like metal-dependent hydrolase (beta-lactamase superfamily II)